MAEFQIIQSRLLLPLNMTVLKQLFVLNTTKITIYCISTLNFFLIIEGEIIIFKA
mgnify:CR=1 FL=1